MPAGDPSSGVKLMAGVLSPHDPQEQLNDIARNGTRSPDVVPSPPPASPSPPLATAVALPAAAGGAVDVGALAAGAGAKLAALAGRVGPAMVRAGPLTALASMVIPTNTQSETTELSDGLRARVRPGQRTVEIEQRVDNGLFGTGIGATWKTLPVDAYLKVGSNGVDETVINHQQLNQALGQEAPAEARDAGVSAMAQPPKDVSPAKPPSTATGSEDVTAPDIGRLPYEQSLAPSRIDAKVLEEAKQRNPEEERLLACRAVRAMPGESAPPVQYDGRGGIETASGIRVAPGFPAPKGGYDYSPDYLRHFNGYKGELELKNRIEKAVPYEKFVHYGNPAGDRGPDVLTIGPEDQLMEWDSRSRMAKRRLGPSAASSASLNPQVASIYVWNAIRARAIAPASGVKALQELEAGNYNVCTVGTGNAFDGFFETVRNHVPTGPRR